MATSTATTAARGRRSGVSVAAPAARARTRAAGNSSRAFNTTAAIVLGVFAVLWLIPSLWALKTSLVSNSTASLGAAKILADTHPTLHSYSSLFHAGDIWNWYLASAVTSIVTVLMTVVLASMAAFAISRLAFRGRAFVFVLILAGIMIPGQILVVPLFKELGGVHLLNTYWSVIFPQVPAVIAVFIFKQFFDGLPKELEEAARLDGANLWRVYRQIIMPLSRPVVAATSILTFVTVWNNLLLPLFVLSNPKLMTIPVGLATVQGSFGQRYADIQASAVLGALPLVILYLFFQRQIIEGVAGTGLKG